MTSAWPAGHENVCAERENGTNEKRAIRKYFIDASPAKVSE